MTAKTVSILIASFLIFCSLVFIASANQTNDSDKYTFANYGGEEFTPEPMEFGANLVTGETVVMSTSNILLENESSRKHIFLQFYENTTGEQITLLDSYDLIILKKAADYTLIASMPVDMTAADLPAESGLRWIGEIPVENKYDHIYGLDAPEWARTENGKIKLAVYFYEDVTSQDSTSIIEKYSYNFSTPLNGQPWFYRTIINETNVTLIASEDAVNKVTYYGSEVVPEYDDGFVDYEVIIEEETNDSSMPINEQETNVSDTKNGLDSESKKSPSFSSMMTVLFLALSAILYRRK